MGRINKKQYSLNPKLCKTCNNPISFEKRRNKFCNHSCSAQFNNIGIVRNGASPKHCKTCGKNIRDDLERCLICEIVFKIENGIHVCKGTLRNYVIKIRGHKCEQCGNTHWQGHLIPVDIHHIDGNKKNNILTNLKLLCKNCHGLTENYVKKNTKTIQAMNA